MINSITELRAADQDLMRLPCSELVERLLVVKNSCIVASRNSEQLKEYLEVVKNDPLKRIELLQDYSTRRQRDLHILEFYRLLQNLITSFMVLRDHARATYPKLLEGHTGLEEYYDKVREHFIDVDVAKFLEDYRNYMSHYSNRGISYVPHLSAEERATTFFLDRETLLQWRKWTQKSRLWLQGQNEKFKIEIALNDYSSRLRDFYDWLDLADLRWFGDEIDEYNERVEVLLKAQDRIEGRTRRSTTNPTA